ncbi:MAG: CHASE domain-containing protein, partial [Polyangiaceae bacterium]
MLAVSLIAAYAAWLGAYRNADREIRSYFDFRVRDAQERIVQRLRAYEVVLYGARGLFNASGEVTREEFKNYVASLLLGERFPGIQGVGFAIAISPEKLDEHVAKIRAEGFPDYAIRPPGERDLYTSIVYLEPFRDRNLRAFSFDMYSEITRRTALQRARDDATTAVTGKVLLLQETNVNPQAGFLMYVPVYRVAATPKTVEERRAQLHGWAYAPFRTNDFMEGVLGEKASDLDLEIFDGDEADHAALMYDSFSEQEHRAEQSAMHVRRTIEFGGHRWLVVAGGREGIVEHSAYARTWPVGVAGVAAALLVTLFTWVLTSSRARALAIADERGEELRHLARVQATILANANIGIIFVRDRVIVWANRRMEEMLGFAPDALISMPTRVYYVDEETFDRVGDEGYAKLATGGVYEDEIQLQRADGTRLWAHVYGKAVEGDEPMGGS